VTPLRKEIGMPERPGELIYALDETPPRPHLLALGFQHVAVCPYLVMVALVAEAAKLPHHAAQSAVGLAMIAVAFMTVLQSAARIGWFGLPLSEEKIRSAEHSIVELCRREGLAESLYYASSKEFVEAGKRHLIRRWRRCGHSDPSRESRCRHCSACLQCPKTSIRAPHQPFDFSPK
jgi:hypothetical protein